MRSTLVALTLLAAGCFSEAPSSSGCIDGEAACDCRPDATCDEGLECIASIDKCTPIGCTPGDESCTCVDGNCLSGLVCSGGVCVPPSTATTGDDASVSSTTSTDTVAETTMGPGTTPSTTIDSLTSNSTVPPLDTGETDPTGMSGSVSTDPTLETLSEASISDTSMDVCPECIELSSGQGCAAEYETCFLDDAANGCSQLMECIFEGGTTDACCSGASADAPMLWAALVGCAEMNTCLGGCGLYCP
jgi:hypothetical protein